MAIGRLFSNDIYGLLDVDGNCGKLNHLNIQRPGRRETRLTRSSAFALAVISVGVTLVIECVLRPYLAGQCVFLLFVLPIAVTSWCGGLVPGLAATILAGVYIECFIFGAEFQTEIHARSLRLILFLFEGSVISGLSEALHRARFRLAAMAAENAKLFEAARRGNRAKDEFLAMVSHDLRTPMTAIHGWTRLLRSGTLNSKKSSEALEIIEQSVQSELRLINDILDATQVAATGDLKINRQPLALHPIVESAAHMLIPIAEQKYIVFNTELNLDGCVLLGDADRLKQVIWNLLSNAIKFTPAAKSILLKCNQNETEVKLQISDSGRGISPEFLPFVFDGFRQEDRTVSGAQSLGLGLAISKHIIELHGGTINAESRGKGQGATFTIRLPIHKEMESVQSGRVTAEKACELRSFPPIGVTT